MSPGAPTTIARPPAPKIGLELAYHDLSVNRPQYFLHGMSRRDPTTLQLKVVSGNNGIQSGNNVGGGMDPPSKRCSNTPLPQTNVSHAITHIKTTATPHKKMAHKKEWGILSSKNQQVGRIPYSP